MKCDLMLRANGIVERFSFFASGPSAASSLDTSRYRPHCRRWSRAVTHSTADVSATMMLLLMNYKQTLRPSTFVPVASGLQPGDKWLPAQKTRTRIHTVPLSSIACLLTFLIYITTARRQVTSTVTLFPSSDTFLRLIFAPDLLRDRGFFDPSAILTRPTKESGFDRSPCLKTLTDGRRHLAAGRADKMLSLIEVEGQAARLLPADYT